MGLILGIDEAGRGPVIGPLIIAGVLLEESRLKQLIRLGVKDSKQLNRRQRSTIAQKIMAVARAWQVITFLPKELERNLTQIELEGTAQLIRRLKPKIIYLDAPVPPRAIPNYVRALRQLCHKTLEVIAENKADAKYPIVAAASIIAKVHRDRAIELLKAKYGDFGWGYPSERKTQKFLKDWYAAHGSFPECVRLRWRTVWRLMTNKVADPATSS